MGACVQPDGVCADWFELAKELRPGCVLSSQLFCICFSAVLTVVPRRFSEDTGILAELVHVKVSPTSVGPKPATDYVRRAVWGMLHSDDACIVSRSPLGVAKITEVMEMICRAFVLTVSRVEDRDHAHASTAYTADDRDHVHAPIAYYDASRSGCANLQTGAILHLPKGNHYQNAAYAHGNRQADPAHAGCASGGTPVRSTTSRKWRYPSRPNGKGQGNRGPSVRPRYVKSPGKLLQTPHRTPPGFASHHRGTAQETRHHRMTSYNRAFEITEFESIQATVCTGRLLWGGTLI